VRMNKRYHGGTMKYMTRIWIILSVCTLLFSFAAKPNTYVLADDGNGNNGNGQNGQGNSTGNNTDDGQGNNTDDGQGNNTDNGQGNNTDDGQGDNTDDGQANNTDNGQMNDTDNGQANDKDDGQANDNDDGQMNDKDDDQVNDQQEQYEQRMLEIKQSTTEAKIKSSWQRNELKDAFELRFSTEESLSIMLEYNTENTTNDTYLDFEVFLDKIIEYNDTNNNGRYDESDTIISTYDLEHATFENMIYTTETTKENETVYTISTITVDGVFGIILHVNGNFTKTESGVQTPTEVKIDFIINYNYTSNESNVALKTEINTQYESQTNFDTYDEAQGYAHNESDLKIASVYNTGFFSWAEHALIDNISKPVNVTIVQNEGQGSEHKDIIYFNYPRGKTIVHDPKVGVISLSSLTFIVPQLSIIPANSILIYIAVFGAVSLLFIGSIYIRRRM
jgi:hypothetical protein